ncbi:MAG: 4Fe-4S binding protein [Anaerotruncus sp.]|nr:4Fe-4S binding protein [Anaerotruncus sp.]
MNIRRICALYFSPTGGTEKIARFVTEELARHLGGEPTYVDFTRPENRQSEYRFAEDDLLVMASPVYAGRLPNKLMPVYASSIFGSNTPAVPLCVFGNRNHDQALRELVLLLEGNGFQIAGAAAFAGRHAFSDKVGTGRPDGADLEQMRVFAAKAAEKLSKDAPLPPLDIDRSEIGPYYTPLKEDGTPAKFLKAKPLADPGKCVHCGTCAQACPLHSIDAGTLEAVGLCIKCQACVRRCPKGARYFEDADFLSHVSMLEQNYTARAENQLLL